MPILPAARGRRFGPRQRAVPEARRRGDGPRAGAGRRRAWPRSILFVEVLRGFLFIREDEQARPLGLLGNSYMERLLGRQLIVNRIEHGWACLVGQVLVFDAFLYVVLVGLGGLLIG